MPEGVHTTACAHKFTRTRAHTPEHVRSLIVLNMRPAHHVLPPRGCVHTGRGYVKAMSQEGSICISVLVQKEGWGVARSWV